jgi:pSer/pThr/pTyr-binding forkhead associated (FHA) protein
MVKQLPKRYGCPTSRDVPTFEPVPHAGRTQEAAAQCDPVTNKMSTLSLPDDRTITISVITGSSNGLTHQLAKARTSIGRTGCGADIEIDDPQASALHCVVGVTHDMVRLCDLDSANGTYVNDERVQAAELEHLSEFRLGSTRLVVTIIPKHFEDTT